ncbi:MAG: cellulose biosynthesis protein BcsF [Candidatus Oceanisphaera merdipullorum]|nr:cellulose biosynthesis protein BcsF [Candidatus Oceanisphaera merdipullorum]
MYIGDIIGMLAICALIMLPAGFLARDYLPKFGQWFSARCLAPRYLTAHGVRRYIPTSAVNSDYE